MPSAPTHQKLLTLVGNPPRWLFILAGPLIVLISYLNAATSLLGRRPDILWILTLLLVFVPLTGEAWLRLWRPSWNDTSGHPTRLVSLPRKVHGAFLSALIILWIPIPFSAGPLFPEWECLNFLLPRADPKRFAVSVARLQNDHGDSHQGLIIDAIRDLSGIQALPLPRTITQDSLGEPEELQGQDRARVYLRQTGASILIWGSVVPMDGKTVLRLFLTATTQTASRPRHYVKDPAVRLPELFWNDLRTLIPLVVQAHAAELDAEPGRYLAPKIEPLVAKLRSLLNDGPRGRLITADRSGIQAELARWLTELGKYSDRSDLLLEAVALSREALKDRTRERVPLQWAAAQNNLGNALRELGERDSGPTRLEEAVTAYREALKEYTRERVPLEWAKLQNNVGAALWSLGQRDRGTARLEEAVTAYREALKERTRERVPLQWAMTQNNLGTALSALGEREAGTAHLEEAAAALREALKEYTRERVPMNWAATQNNLGVALLTLGAREPGTARLEQAAAAFRQALLEYTHERLPLDWAMTQNNLGNALLSLGEREAGTAHLEEAAAAYRDVLKEWTRERLPLDWAMAMNNLGNALRNLGDRQADTARLEEAVTTLRQALNERTRERVPLDWAATQNNLGTALWGLGERKQDTALLEEAVAAYREALKEYTRETAPLQWAMTQRNLQDVRSRLSRRSFGFPRHNDRVHRPSATPAAADSEAARVGALPHDGERSVARRPAEGPRPS